LATIHLISFDIPLPANYGGVIDVFSKIKSLHQMGVKIILHCFEYDGKKRSELLATYCEKVHYYPRKKSWRSFFSTTPFIVQTRKNESLINELCKDNFPILFEGLHCCYYLNDPRIQHRIKVVRTHNIEHAYYRSLAIHEPDLFKKIFFYLESIKLHGYEKILAKANAILAISAADHTYFAAHYANVQLINAFHLNDAITSLAGQGNYCLYHGNLSVQENVDALKYLVEQVFKGIDTRLVVAGKNPSEQLTAWCTSFPNMECIANPDDDTMHQLIQGAQINIIYSFQNAGMKLKLLNVLFQGRFCVANRLSFSNQDFESLVIKAETATDFKNQIKTLMTQSFTEDKIEWRRNLLKNGYSNTDNALRIITLLQ